MCVALSTTEPVVEASEELFWIKKFLGEFGCAQERYVNYCDNQNTIHLDKNSTFDGRSKYIDLRSH